MRSLEGDICLCSAAILNHFNASPSRKGDKAVKKASIQTLRVPSAENLAMAWVRVRKFPVDLDIWWTHNTKTMFTSKSLTLKRSKSVWATSQHRLLLQHSCSYCIYIYRGEIAFTDISTPFQNWGADVRWLSRPVAISHWGLKRRSLSDPPSSISSS